MAQWTVDAKLALLRQHDEGVPWTRLAATAGVPVRTLSLDPPMNLGGVVSA